MNKQEVIEKLRNDEITLYTDILINDLLEDILKSAFPEDLFDLKYLKINEYYHNDNAGWDYSGYNIKKLPIINLSNIEMKKYTVRECYENKYSIWCTTVEQANIINKATGSENDWKILIKNEPFEVFIISWKTGNVYNCSYQTSCTKEYFIKEGTWDGKFAKKCIDFSELKLENKMEEIIGYNYKPEFEQAITKLLPLGSDSWNINTLKAHLKNNGYNIRNCNNEKDTYTKYFNDLGVLNLWFEPVYTPQFKIGDYVIWKAAKDQNNVYKICGISDNGYDLEWKGRNVFYGKENIPFRKATEKEISDRLTKTLILGDTKIEIIISKNSIKADGKSFNINDLINLTTNMKGYDSMGYYLKFSNVTIGCCTFTLQELESIITEYNKLNG